MPSPQDTAPLQRRIRIITPLCDVPEGMQAATLSEVSLLEPLGLAFDVVSLEAGPSSIETAFDEALAAPYVAIAAITAQADGVDAVIIDCMGDPGVDAARTMVAIPVIGPGEAAMHTAAMLGHRFSCVSVLDSVRPLFFNRAKICGVADKLASVRTINVPVLDIEAQQDVLPDKLFEQSVIAIEQDLADTIVLGCTGFVGLAHTLQDRLHKSGYDVPVIDPIPNAALVANLMIRGGLSHSARAYGAPGTGKRYTGYPVPPDPMAQR